MAMSFILFVCSSVCRLQRVLLLAARATSAIRPHILVLISKDVAHIVITILYATLQNTFQTYNTRCFAISCRLPLSFSLHFLSFALLTFVATKRGGDWAGPQPAQALLAVPNVTGHPSMASVPTSNYSMWHYNCLWSLKG